MKRRLFNLLAILSLLLGVATVALWVRSFQMGETVVWRARGPIPPSGRALWAVVGANEGRFFLATVKHQPSDANERWSVDGVNGDDGPRPVWRSAQPTKLIAPNPSPTIWTRLGFEHQSSNFGFISSYIDLSRLFFGDFWFVPCWAVLAVVELPAILWLAMFWRKRRRHRVGCCQKCGYDLRATPDRCPECGLVPTAKAIAPPQTIG